MSPNPTRGDMDIRFELNESSDATFAVFDLLGRLVYFNEMEKLPVGGNTIQLDLNGVNNGLYLVQMEIGGAQVSEKLMIND